MYYNLAKPSRDGDAKPPTPAPMATGSGVANQHWLIDPTSAGLAHLRHTVSPCGPSMESGNDWSADGFFEHSGQSPWLRAARAYASAERTAAPCGADTAVEHRRGHRAGGFTLTEMLIAVAVVGILVTVAVPSYSSVMVRVNRSAALYMTDVANRQEQHMTRHQAYTDIIGAGGLGVTPPMDVAASYTFALRWPAMIVRETRFPAPVT